MRRERRHGRRSRRPLLPATKRAPTADHLSPSSGPRRDDQNRAAGDPDEAVGDTPEERRLERAPATRPDDDEFGLLVIGNLGQPLGWNPDLDALLGVPDASVLCHLLQQA